MMPDTSRSKVDDHNNCLWYDIGGITIRLRADIEFASNTYHPKFEKFRVQNPGHDSIDLCHHFSVPPPVGKTFGQLIYSDKSWAVYRSEDSWIYIYNSPDDPENHKTAVYCNNYSVGNIYHGSDKDFCKGQSDSLTFFPNDQMLLVQLLADRQGCLFHGSGLVMQDQGLLFLGHSGVGKSTLSRMLQRECEVLSDERIILRRFSEEWEIFGTWFHSDLPEISPMSVPIKAIFILEQAETNTLIRRSNPEKAVREMLPFIIRGVKTKEWWEKILDLAYQAAIEIPVYQLKFDKSGQIIPALRSLY